MRTSAPSPATGSATSQSPRLDLADASVLRTVRGVPSWAAVLIAIVLTSAGAAVDALVTGTLSWGFRTGFLAGIGLAALAVRRGSIFTAMVQAPLVMVVVTVAAQRLLVSQRFTFALIKVVNAFPTMAIGTAFGLLLGLVRILAQPMRTRRSARPVRQHA